MAPGIMARGILTEESGYMAILPILFALLTIMLFLRKDKQIIFWTMVGLLGFLLVLGNSTPIYSLMYRVPVYNMFRASARNWLEVNFAIAVLASFFIHFLIVNIDVPKQSFYKAVHWLVIALISSVFFILQFGSVLIATPGNLRSLVSNFPPHFA